MSSPDTACVVLTTVPSREAARSLATRLVENRLAACVQLSAIESVYRWQGSVQHEEEVLLLIKTRSELYAPLEAFIKEVHSYEVPEILQLPVQAGAETYLRWLADATA
jgi:periplasmic divalent cation tolerance protein